MNPAGQARIRNRGTPALTHHVASHSCSHSQYWRGFIELGVCAVVHQAMQVVGLGRGDYPTDVAALRFGSRTVAAGVGRLLTHHLQGRADTLRSRGIRSSLKAHAAVAGIRRPLTQQE